MENRAKTDTTRAKPSQHHPTKTRRPPTKYGEKTPCVLWEEQTRDAPTKMKKPTVWKSCAIRHRRPTSRQPRRPHDTRSRCTHHGEPLGPPPRHPTALPHPADHQHHLPGPPSRRTTARARAATPHDPATRSPRCTG
jgi:hypothetical protein